MCVACIYIKQYQRGLRCLLTWNFIKSTANFVDSEIISLELEQFCIEIDNLLCINAFFPQNKLKGF